MRTTAARNDRRNKPDAAPAFTGSLQEDTHVYKRDDDTSDDATAGASHDSE
jgi:hypothetical protein